MLDHFPLRATRPNATAVQNIGPEGLRDYRARLLERFIDGRHGRGESPFAAHES